ncbi:uncharacterized protein LOC135373872 [Ornithodoros turicata]|uniref:uncharacterized protein LOC135373872 n=1 Tax=Ornithodoros turicata TaxID=34597 RepID=UPI003138925A
MLIVIFVYALLTYSFVWTASNFYPDTQNVTSMNSYLHQAGSPSMLSGAANKGRAASIVQDTERGMTSFETKCLKVVLENRMLLRELNQRIAALETTSRCGEPLQTPVVPELEVLLEQPISTREELSHVEDVLSEASAKIALTNRLARLGGGDLKEVVKIVLDRTMKNEVQALFSIEGRRGKSALKTSPLFSVIISDVQQRLSGLKQDVTDAEIQARVGKYLAGSCDREGGRKRRMKDTE